MSSPPRSILSTTTANISPQKTTSPSRTQTSSSSTKSENQPLASENAAQVKSMDYHRQVLKEKLDDGSNGVKYVSPSDGIMSPCTQKLSALKGRQFGKAKPKSLFAQTAGKSVDVGSLDEKIGGKVEKGVGE